MVEVWSSNLCAIHGTMELTVMMGFMGETCFCILLVPLEAAAGPQCCQQMSQQNLYIRRTVQITLLMLIAYFSHMIPWL